MVGNGAEGEKRENSQAKGPGPDEYSGERGTGSTVFGTEEAIPPQFGRIFQVNARRRTDFVRLRFILFFFSTGSEK